MAEDTKSVDQGAEGSQKPSGTEGKSNEELAAIFENPDDSKLTPAERAFKNKILSEYRQKRETEGQELAELRAKTKEAEEWRKTAQETGIEIKTSLKKEGQKLIDQMIDASDDPEVRKNYLRARNIIREETEIDALKAEVKELKEALGNFQDFSKIQMVSRADDAITKFKSEWDEKIISKHEKELRNAVSSYPKLSLGQIFKNVLPDEDLELAYLIKAEKKKESENKRKLNAASSSGESASSEEAPIVKDKRGVTDIRKTLEGVLKSVR